VQVAALAGRLAITGSTTAIKKTAAEVSISKVFRLISVFSPFKSLYNEYYTMMKYFKQEGRLLSKAIDSQWDRSYLPWWLRGLPPRQCDLFWVH
jgi:hypothetical protein